MDYHPIIHKPAGSRWIETRQTGVPSKTKSKKLAKPCAQISRWSVDKPCMIYAYRWQLVGYCNGLSGSHYNKWLYLIMLVARSIGRTLARLYAG